MDNSVVVELSYKTKDNRVVVVELCLTTDNCVVAVESRYKRPFNE